MKINLINKIKRKRLRKVVNCLLDIRKTWIRINEKSLIERIRYMYSFRNDITDQFYKDAEHIYRIHKESYKNNKLLPSLSYRLKYYKNWSKNENKFNK